MSKRAIICPGCGVPLKVIETEVDSGSFMRPTVFSCANCGHFLGISPYVGDAESQSADTHSAVLRLRDEVLKRLAALPVKKAKKSK
jgi:hypothetical protein